MARRMLGGVAAWLVSVLPLAIVNGIAAFGWVDVSVAAAVGALTLVLGVAMGAFTAGWIGGRTPDLSTAETPGEDDARPGYLGARGALWSGGLAGLLYALTMGGLLFAAAQANVLPTIILQHPLRISAAVISVACVLAGASLLVGWFAGRQAPNDEAVAPAQRLAHTIPQSHATQRPTPAEPIRQAAPTRPLYSPRQAASDMRAYAPPRPPTPSPSAPRRSPGQQGRDQESLDWEGLPDLRGPMGDNRYAPWEQQENRAPSQASVRREQR